MQIVLVDLSSIAHPIWHMSQAEPDPNATCTKIVDRVRALASEFPHAAICCDAGRSFRRDITATYKANRPESDATLQHQITLARELLEADGFPIWSVKGFEADDLIASATVRAITLGHDVLVVSADKDLLQLVSPQAFHNQRVRVMSSRDGAIFDAEAVRAKFGVDPSQMRDYLMLVGDTSDNVKGAKDVGPKKAAALLTKYGTVEDIYTDLALHGTNFTPALATSLKEFFPRADEVRQLITLRDDVEIPFDEVLAERVIKAEPFGEEEDPMTMPEQEPLSPEAEATVKQYLDGGKTDAPQGYVAGSIGPTEDPAPKPAPNQQMAVRESSVPAPAPAEWERQLDPRSMDDAIAVSKYLHASRMFSAYGTPQAVLSTIMLGRELGLPAMGSLRSVHIIEGKHSLSADVMVALVLRSGFAEYFEPISFSETEATFETHRKGSRNPVRLTHTIDMAQKAWSKTTDAWLKSGWGRNPTDMLVARAKARLARMIYPDLLAGLYTPEELRDIQESAAA